MSCQLVRLIQRCVPRAEKFTSQWSVSVEVAVPSHFCRLGYLSSQSWRRPCTAFPVGLERRSRKCQKSQSGKPDVNPERSGLIFLDIESLYFFAMAGKLKSEIAPAAMISRWGAADLYLPSAERSCIKIAEVLWKSSRTRKASNSIATTLDGSAGNLLTNLKNK